MERNRVYREGERWDKSKLKLKIYKMKLRKHQSRKKFNNANVIVWKIF